MRNRETRDAVTSTPRLLLFTSRESGLSSVAHPLLMPTTDPSPVCTLMLRVGSQVLPILMHTLPIR